MHFWPPTNLVVMNPPLTKSQLADEIEAYAAAKATGNVLLMTRQTAVLKSVIEPLFPEEAAKTEDPSAK